MVSLAWLFFGGGASVTAQVTTSDPRPPASHKKLDPKLLLEVYLHQGIPARARPVEPTGVQIDEKKRALVEIETNGDPKLVTLIGSIGGTLVRTPTRSKTLTAWIPIFKLEPLAEETAVLSMKPAPANALDAR